MYSERLQLLLSPGQRRRLDAEARRTGASVASLVREAIDERYGRMPTDEERRAAFERLAWAGESGPLRETMTPEDINRAHSEAVEDRARRAGLELRG